VDIHVKKEGIEKILKKLFPNGEMNFKIIEKQIVLTRSTAVNEVKKVPEKVIKVQDLDVNGTVTDANGAPLPGASILEKGTGKNRQYKT
jgi:protocatechuate 3,4-dioxygenase beta subunit